MKGLRTMHWPHHYMRGNEGVKDNALAPPLHEGQ